MRFNNAFNYGFFFQALEGSRELENIIGVSDLSCILSAEVQKTQVLSKEDFQ